MARRPDELFDKIKIKKLCSDIQITDEQRNAAKEWLNLLENNKLESEQQNRPKFEQIILQKILGFSVYDFVPEKDDIDYTFSNPKSSNSLCIEVKGTSTKDLFAYQGRGKRDKENPVAQTWTYMGLGYDYGVCTNYNDFILLTMSGRTNKVHKFNFLSIKDTKNHLNEDKLKEFIGIFSKSRIFAEGIVEKLTNESVIAEQEFTDEFYKLFHETRLMLYTEFSSLPDVSKDEAIHWAQIYLNRLIFVFFVEDHNFIPDRLFAKRILSILKSPSISEHTKIISENINDLFKIMNTGSKIHGVNGFNGGLFEKEIPSNIFFSDIKDPEFFKNQRQNSKLSQKSLLVDIDINLSSQYADSLNPIIKNLLLMDSYDFTSDLNVNILGHIFEQSISDLEEIKEEGISRRKKEGVYYTPEYITDYICRNAIIPHLSNNDVTSISELVEEYVDNIEELETKIKNLKILDPACGSGAFLVKAVDILLEIDEKIQAYKPQSAIVQKGLEEYSIVKEINLIVESNIFGVDINPESVEITKLSLFLKLAGPNTKLTYLSNNIKIGNSLIDDKTIDKHAFCWTDEFPEILNPLIKDKGFDIVIGNPPYVVLNPEKLNKYNLVKGNYNTYVAFIEKGITLTKDNGKISFIVPTTWLSGNNYEGLRKKILDYSITHIIQLPYDIFEAYIDTMIISINKKYDENNIVKTYKYEISDKAYHKPIEKYISIEQSKWKNNDQYTIILDSDLESIYQKYKRIKSEKLGTISKVNRGTLPPKQNELFPSPKNDNFIEWFDGQIYRYVIHEGSGMFVDYTKLREGKSLELFSSPKIMGRQLVSRQFRLQFAWFDKKVAFKKNLYAIYNNKLDPYFLLSILNSKLFSFIHVKANISVQRDDFPSFSLQDFRNFLIPNTDKDIEKNLSELAKKLSYIKQEHLNKSNKVKRRILDNFSISSLGNILEKFQELEFKEFLVHIQKKSKQKLSLSQQDDWEDYFSENKIELLNLNYESKKIEQEINELVYDIYGLNIKEKNLIEKTLSQ